MKTCFVAMPFGRETGSGTGSRVDFDRLYREVVQPAAERAGFVCQRADELPLGAVLQKTILTAVIQSDVMIADLTTGNPNVLYEMGVRHALRRGQTILLLRKGDLLPVQVSYTRTLTYDVETTGALTAASAVELRGRIETTLRQIGPLSADSPVFELFPDLRVELPAAPVATWRSRKTSATRGSSSRSAEGESTKLEGALSFGVEMPEIGPSPDPITLLNTLKGYRGTSDWDALIRDAEQAPPELASSPEVIHLVTLALNRRGHPGDQERAIELLEKSVRETGGGGSETLGILGKIYRERYATQGGRQNLERAIDAFQTAFEKFPNNFYVGVNLVSLLYEAVLRDGGASFREKLERFLPQVRSLVESKLASGEPDYWEITAGLHLACLAGDWASAERLAGLALQTAPSTWMIESTLHDLEEIPRPPDGDRHEGLQTIIETLRQGVLQRPGGGGLYA